MSLTLDGIPQAAADLLTGVQAIKARAHLASGTTPIDSL